MKLSHKAANKAHRVLLFGPPKSGKTQLAGELALHGFNLIFFDLENGVDTLLKLPKEIQENVEVISLPDTRIYPIGIETMLKVIKGAPLDICEAHGKVSCAICKKAEAPSITIFLNNLGPKDIVIVDSLTQLTNSAIAHITKHQDELYKLEYDDWANLGKLMDTFLSQVQQASFNIICISHETEVKMEDGKNKLVPTAGTTNFSRNTAKYFDEVVYCEVKNGKHVAGSSTSYANNILTGSRTGQRLEASPGNASLAGIFNNEIPTFNPVTATSPENKSMTALEKLKMNLAAKK